MQVVDQLPPSSASASASAACPSAAAGALEVPSSGEPVVLADWLTEELAQRIYALRQDLAELAETSAADPREIAAVRDGLLAITRRIGEVAALLRSGACRQAPGGRAAALAREVAGDCEHARTLMARAAELATAGPAAA